MSRGLGDVYKRQGMENTKYQEAVLVAKTYLLKKINSMAYQLHLEDIQNILD